MSRLDGTAKRTSRAIIKSLLENAAAKTSTERQIHEDEPEEAPKEEKEALVKKVQKPEVPHKEHIVEGETLGNQAVFEIDYAPDGVDLSTEEDVINSIKSWLGDLANEVHIEVLNLKGPAAGWPEVRLSGNKEKIGQFLANKYEENIEDVYDSYLVKGEEIEECDQVTSVELNEEVDDYDKQEDALTKLQNEIVALQDQLNSPEISEEERAELQAQIDELLDEINYFENEEMFKGNLPESSLKEEDYKYEELEMWVNELYHLGATRAYEEVLEQTGNAELADDVAAQIEIMHDENNDIMESLTEAENPENAEINKKILSTLRARTDGEPRFKKDLEAAGFKVTKDYGEWYIEGPNGRRISKYDITGGQQAHFNPEERKHADYYNYLTKPVDEDKRNSFYNRNRVDRQYKPIQRINKYHHWNDETKQYDPGVEYSNKAYDRRQKRSQGYDFNDLRYGSKDIQDFKKSKDDEYFHHKAKGWSLDDVEKANQKLADFQASISDKIKELQDNIERAKNNFNSHETGEKQAQQTRQDIMNRRREARNK